MKVLCLICARGGSKGVPGKNYRVLVDKPLIAWSIETGKEVVGSENVVVSTDSTRIADIATRYGARVPCLRPDGLATDKALQIDAIRHMVLFLEGQRQIYDAVLLLQPTCPVRCSEDVARCLKMMSSTGCDTVISLAEVHGGLSTFYRHGDKGAVTQIEVASTQGILRQEVEPLYHRSGSVYLIKRDVIVHENAIYGKDVRGVVFGPEASFNIDTEFDWRLTSAWIGRQKDNRNG